MRECVWIRRPNTLVAVSKLDLILLCSEHQFNDRIQLHTQLITHYSPIYFIKMFRALAIIASIVGGKFHLHVLVTSNQRNVLSSGRTYQKLKMQQLQTSRNFLRPL